MYIQQLYTKCLSESSYFIVDNGEAAVVDPLRDIDQYLQLAKEHNAEIKYVFETHFHADFVSGHLDLAQRTGAAIVYGPNTQAGFAFYKAKDGELFTLGNIKIKALHTPGHTLESTCYLLLDEKGVEHCVFTGDTLFVGDVGRPDLFSGNLSKEELAAMMYHSLQSKIKSLPDATIVYPAHGPGSACGKNLGPETYSTIGVQKLHNYALQEMSEEDFIQQLCANLPEPPVYFPINAQMNQKGSIGLEVIKENSMKALDLAAFKQWMAEGAYVLDTRDATVFTQAFIPEAISIGLEGRFAEWAGTLLPYGKPIVLVTATGQEEESIIRLARVGLDTVMGFLEGGFATWQDAGEPIDLIIDVDADELAMDLPFDPKLAILDVRKESEYKEAHVQGAQLMPLQEFADIFNVASIETDKNLYLHCGGGYRSVIAASLLKRQGFHNLRNVLGGFSAIKEQSDIPIVSGDSTGS